MSALKRRHQEVRRLREARQKERNVKAFYEEMNEIFRESAENNSLGDWSVRHLFEACVDDGFELVNNYYGPDSAGGYRLQEAGDAVNTSLFANTMGQYLYNAVLQAYQMPELIGDKLMPVQSTIESGEKIPGVTELGDEVEVVQEGNPYPTASVTEKWITTPATTKRGLIVNITKESVFFDKTGQLLGYASNVGKTIAINREKRMLDAVLGITTIYSRNGGAPEATYQSENTITTTPLVDWTSLDAADTKFMAITDPDTGEPIVTTADTLIVPPALRNLAMRIVNATLTNNAANNAVRFSVNGNSLNQPYTYLTNQYVKTRGGSDSTWWYGRPRDAFVYMQNWPLTVQTIGVDGEASFERDIVARYKASERGTPAIRERRFMLKATA